MSGFTNSLKDLPFFTKQWLLEAQFKSWISEGSTSNMQYANVAKKILIYQRWVARL